MTDKHTQEQAAQSNMEKPPEDWVTGDEPMTGAQRSYLKTLSEEAHETFDENLTKAEASRRIEELQALTGRGRKARNEAHAHLPADYQASEAPESPMQSLGRAVVEPVIGSAPPPGQEKTPDRGSS